MFRFVNHPGSFDASVFQGRSQELLLGVHKSEMRGLGATLGPQRVKAPRELKGFNYRIRRNLSESKIKRFNKKN